jgi:ribonuclease PH
MARKNRGNLELRSLTLERGVNRYAEGSSLIKWGHTHVLVTATLDNKVPLHVKGGKKGWLMAEYAMLPRATHQRSQRESQASGGRRQEIQRLLGRTFRSAVNLELFRDKTLVLDCDVIQADGGTRVASIVGGYVALFDLAQKLIQKGQITDWPLLHEIGAVSVGMVDNHMMLDLDFNEDSRAEADLNVVATSDGKIFEVQGGTEKAPLEPDKFQELIGAGLEGIKTLMGRVKEQL